MSTVSIRSSLKRVPSLWWIVVCSTIYQGQGQTATWPIWRYRDGVVPGSEGRGSCGVSWYRWSGSMPCPVVIMTLSIWLRCAGGDSPVAVFWTWTFIYWLLVLPSIIHCEKRTFCSYMGSLGFLLEYSCLVVLKSFFIKFYQYFYQSYNFF